MFATSSCSLRSVYGTLGVHLELLLRSWKIYCLFEHITPDCSVCSAAQWAREWMSTRTQLIPFAHCQTHCINSTRTCAREHAWMHIPLPLCFMSANAHWVILKAVRLLTPWDRMAGICPRGQACLAHTRLCIYVDTSHKYREWINDQTLFFRKITATAVKEQVSYWISVFANYRLATNTLWGQLVSWAQRGNYSLIASRESGHLLDACRQAQFRCRKYCDEDWLHPKAKSNSGTHIEASFSAATNVWSRNSHIAQSNYCFGNE